MSKKCPEKCPEKWLQNCPKKWAKKVLKKCSKKNWFASIDMTYKLDDKIITVDMKYQTLWQKANAISLKWSQYWAKFYKKKLPSEYIFITAPFYNDNGEPEYHKHMYKLWIMMSDDMTMYRNKIKYCC